MRFGSLDQLMSWAFGVRSSVNLSGIYAMRTQKDAPPKRFYHGEPLSAMDILTQKGMVKSYIHRQTSIARYHLLASYSRGKERIDAQNKVRDYLLPRMPTGFHNRRMLYELVAKFYGKAVDLNAVAEHMNIETRVVLSSWRLVDGMLDDLRYRVSDEAATHYRESGLISE